MKKFSQRLGEGVRIYKKTEEDEDFVQQEKLVDTTRYRCALPARPLPCSKMHLIFGATRRAQGRDGQTGEVPGAQGRTEEQSQEAGEDRREDAGGGQEHSTFISQASHLYVPSRCS